MAVSDDEIRLVIPTDPAYGRIARIAAASLALRMGFSTSEVEDLRIAVDEMFILLSRPDDPGHPEEPAPKPTQTVHGQIAFVYRVEPGVIEVRASSESTVADTPPCDEDCARFGEIVEGIVDSWSIDAASQTICIAKAVIPTH